MASLYLIKRGPPSEGRKAPFHPIIICARKHTAEWECGAGRDSAWMWQNDLKWDGAGWLLRRWNGLIVDYGLIVSSFRLPDGTMSGFAHTRETEPWTLLRGAVWWSDKQIPDAWGKWGVISAPDDFTRQAISEDVGICLLPWKQQEREKERRLAAPEPGKEANP